ncbi:hypothetical protein [Acidiplasma aeolicum]|uniref:Transposase n=1 Tax=Acidiplasma aeolicum TaxID=507754 RepID=A0A0Q0RV71_9ARCH|nr:hypothetical protein [Acidiplasma aeolicum]KQB36198.1 hypothetical protein AOG54_07845 [Acidiplasma aeolicum]
MTPKPINFKSNRDIRRYRYFNYRKNYSKKYINAMNDFLNFSVFNRWRELLEENNYNKMERPFKVPGIVIMYLAKLRELYNLPFRLLETELHNLSKIFKFPEISFTSIYRRIRKIIPEIDNDNNILSAIDSSGFQITLTRGHLNNKRHRKE